MNRELAEKVVSALVRLSVDIYLPIDGACPEVSDAEWSELKTAVTDVWASIYFEVMPLMVRQYPGLDPGSDDSRRDPDNGSLRQKTPSLTPSRQRCGELVATAATTALADLKQLTQLIADESYFDEQDDLMAHLAVVRRAVESLRVLGDNWSRHVPR